MAFFGGRKERAEKAEGPAKLPDSITIVTQRGEAVLAAAQDDFTQAWVAMTTYRIVVTSPEGEALLDRPWHEVDTGAWEPDSAILSLSWVGGTTAQQWRMRTLTGPGRSPEVFRDRVSASVVQVREVKLSPKRTARVSIRSVLSTRELVDQVALGRGARASDRELALEVERVRQEARAGVGLPPAQESPNPS
ncbi:MAG: hypothetical protein WBA72_00450 [Ornithinimicrobium sp.]